jgi:hypothetical protein
MLNSNFVKRREPCSSGYIWTFCAKHHNCRPFRKAAGKLCWLITCHAHTSGGLNMATLWLNVACPIYGLAWPALSTRNYSLHHSLQGVLQFSCIFSIAGAIALISDLGTSWPAISPSSFSFRLCKCWVKYACKCEHNCSSNAWPETAPKVVDYMQLNVMWSMGLTNDATSASSWNEITANHCMPRSQRILKRAV